MDREQDIIQNASLQGNIFSRDTKKVLAIIREITLDTDAGTWMKGKRCGREKCWHCRIIMISNQRVNAGNGCMRMT